MQYFSSIQEQRNLEPPRKLFIKTKASELEYLVTTKWDLTAKSYL